MSADRGGGQRRNEAWLVALVVAAVVVLYGLQVVAVNSPLPRDRGHVVFSWPPRDEVSAATGPEIAVETATPLALERAPGAQESPAMNDVTGYLSSLFLSVAIALVVALVLRKPLGELLVELCGNQRRARFWAAFTSITLVLGAMLGTLLSIPGGSEPAWDGLAGLRGMLVGLRSGTFLLLLVIATMGFVMLIGISRVPAAKALEEWRG